ncbi:uncharacterized protein NMK_2184 [Novimethylophilus kurashikiensis]|uniref:Uncharacterized protein n=1 Tax=Novimethylophilus kurashikiensis TaxID=1825523 RepID=A0A2R5F972_9PROT|nr:hypothetical protein [Novimethylophilus kurashikiensis]GBG14585.1 uncharacterized protein NMK_2184 [Novimethylophilus kurashikiensis]
MQQTVESNNGFAVTAYLAFLDAVMAECGPCKCLMPNSNAITRRAKLTYQKEKAALTQKLEQLDAATTVVPEEFYNVEWNRLLKRVKYSLLSYDYSLPTTTPDFRFPRDGRNVPVYARDVLGQLRTLQEITFAYLKQQGKMQ